jgi:hypothetical protein
VAHVERSPKCGLSEEARVSKAEVRRLSTLLDQANAAAMEAARQLESANLQLQEARKAAHPAVCYYCEQRKMDVLPTCHGCYMLHKDSVPAAVEVDACSVCEREPALTSGLCINCKRAVTSFNERINNPVAENRFCRCPNYIGSLGGECNACGLPLPGATLKRLCTHPTYHCYNHDREDHGGHNRCCFCQSDRKA